MDDVKLFGKVVELWRYPVSSMGGERLEQAGIGSSGVHGDRIWGVMDVSDGEVAGPEKRRRWRPLPNLASRLGADGPEVRDTYGTWHPARTPDASLGVSDHLGFAVQLKPHSVFQQSLDDHVAPRYGRADIHIVTTASLSALKALLGDPDEVDSRRFRPNIVIETEAGFSGFAEHGIIGRTLRVGQVLLSVTEPCARCAFTSIAQGDLSFEPAVLHKIAQHGDGGFGAYCAVVKAGMIGLNDSVFLTND